MRIKRYILIFIVVFTVLSYVAFRTNTITSKNTVPAYWVWGGIGIDDIPDKHAELYLQQGYFKITKTNQAYYRHRGLYAYPAFFNNIHLVYRLDNLVTITSVTSIIKHDIARWRRHNVKVIGVQLDFDAATRKLADYVEYLGKIKHNIDSNLIFSTTGLGTWLLEADSNTLARFENTVDYIVYQLYVGRRPIKNITSYERKLRQLKAPFKTGLLKGQLLKNNNIKDNSNYKGSIIFYQK
ncbi:MAG: DUF3142 domain-containing protein [Thiohalomonadales bacterium]